MTKRLRNFVFTLNNYTVEQMTDLITWHSANTTYSIFGKEIGESGTPHLQGYCELTKQTAFKKLLKQLPHGIHIEARRGTAKQASDYCAKEDKEPFVYGVISAPGKRTDINELKELMKDSNSLITCMDHNFGLTCRIQRGLETYRRIKRNPRRTVLYYEQRGGTAPDLDDDTYEVYVDRKHPELTWAGYDCQDKVVLWTEFTDDIPNLRKLKSGKPMHLAYKGGSIPAKFTKLLVIYDQHNKKTI